MKLSKKRLIAIIICAALVFAAALTLTLVFTLKPSDNPANPDIPPTLKFDPNKITSYVGNTFRGNVVGLSDGETVAEYLSNNTDVVTVDKDGIIAAVGIGITTVKATTTSGRVALAQVEVADNSIQSVPSVVFSKSSLTLAVNEKYPLDAAVLYDGETVNATVSWTSSDEQVAVIEKGSVKAVKQGAATLIAQATYQEQTCTVKVTLNVLEDGFAFIPDYRGREIWRGNSFELTVSLTENGVTAKAQNVEYVSSNPDIANIMVSDGKAILTALTGGNVTVTASFSHNGTEYVEKTDLFVYGYHTVSVYALGYATVNRDHRITQKMYGDKITLSLNNQVEGRLIKCWYVNGRKIEGNTFVMPDSNVTAYAKYVNETEGDFTASFTEGALYGGNQSVATFVKSNFADSQGNLNTDGNYVRIDNANSNGSSLKFNFDEPVLVSNSASAVLRVYIPNATVSLCLGVGNTKQPPYSVSGQGKYAITAGQWIEITVPLNDFVNNDTLLDGISIGVSGSYVLIDYVMLKY